MEIIDKLDFNLHSKELDAFKLIGGLTTFCDGES
jgi:hypothetical protein